MSKAYLFDWNNGDNVERLWYMKGIIAQIPVRDDRGAFPATVWVLRSRRGGKACFRLYDGDLTGLAVFSSETHAVRFGEWFEREHGMRMESMSLPVALVTAKMMGHPVECLFLLDDVDSPLIYVL